MLTLAIIAALALGLALDVADTMHKLAVEERDGHGAGLASVTMYALGLIGAKLAIDGTMYLAIPTCVGLYIGTRLAMRRARPRS